MFVCVFFCVGAPGATGENDKQLDRVNSLEVFELMLTAGNEMRVKLILW